jgi:hypothetical protein
MTVEFLWLGGMALIGAGLRSSPWGPCQMLGSGFLVGTGMVAMLVSFGHS